MARHKLGFDRLETRRMLAADGCEPMTLPYNPPEVADAAAPADGAFALPAFSPPIRFSRVMEPINGVVYVMHYEGAWVTGDNDDPMLLGVSWWTTLPRGQGGGSQESPTDEGRPVESADEEPSDVSDGAPSERDLANVVCEPSTRSETSDVEDSAALATGVIFALTEGETAQDDSPEFPQDTTLDTCTETTEVNGVDDPYIGEFTPAEALERAAGDDDQEKLDVESDEGMIADWEGVALWGEDSESV